MERLDAVGVIYRLASSIAAEQGPIGLRWYRAAPLDASIQLPDGRNVGVVRQGLTSDRTGFAKRLWRLREGSHGSLSPSRIEWTSALTLGGCASIGTIKIIADEALERLSPEVDRMYSKVGRASVPPERLLKASVLNCLYSVTGSERPTTSTSALQFPFVPSRRPE